MPAVQQQESGDCDAMQEPKTRDILNFPASCTGCVCPPVEAAAGRFELLATKHFWWLLSRFISLVTYLWYSVLLYLFRLH